MIVRIKDFSGGLNNRFRAVRIPENCLSAVRNARWTRFGALSKRLGTTRNVVSAASSIRSLFSYQLSSMANEQLLLADSAGEIYRSTAIGTYIAMSAGLGTTYEPNFAVLADKVYFTNGQSTVGSINASNVLANPTGAPRSRYMAVHKNYLFYLNDPVTPNSSRLQWSNRGLGDTYTSTDFEDIFANDGAYGSGMISYGDELIVFKGPFFSNQSYSQGSMFRVLGDLFDASNPTYAIERIPLPTGVSLVHSRTARILNGLLIFATNDGFYGYGGGGRPPIQISEGIRGEISNWQKLDVHSPTRRAAATVFNNKYICSLYNSGDSADLYNNRIYIFDDGKWWIDILSGTSDDFTTSFRTGTDWAVFAGNLYSCAGSSNQFRQWEVASTFTENTDTGSTAYVNFSAQTREIDFEEDVIFTHCFVHCRRQSSGTLTFETNIDQRGVASTGLDITAPDTGDTANSSSNVLKKQVAIGRQGRTIQFRFYDNGNNDEEIYEIELHVEKLGTNRDYRP